MLETAHFAFLARLLGLVLVVTGYFGPWVAHKTAALTVTGSELAEFAKLLPQVEGGTLGIRRELFLTPLIAAALLVNLLATTAGKGRIFRLTAAGLGALMALTALPPYDFLLDPRYRGHLVLATTGLLLVLVIALTRCLRPRIRGILAALLALVGGVPALWQFALLRRVIAALYTGNANQPLRLGWGVVACAAGFMLVFVTGAVEAASPASRRPVRPREA